METDAKSPETPKPGCSLNMPGGMMAMIAGLLLIALPIAIISQKFQDCLLDSY